MKDSESSMNELVTLPNDWGTLPNDSVTSPKNFYPASAEGFYPALKCGRINRFYTVGALNLTPLQPQAKASFCTPKYCRGLKNSTNKEGDKPPSPYCTQNKNRFYLR